ncbi:MAG: 2-hydroxychromene-2-carboxylate isomerase [Rhodospirillales bacterium]|nr:2-hydroxychromene-2-carboxylate isomerase [Rhodospirillales bacterium]MDE0378742.1 2-hydroxychromene-2-carboxylate isomerase [Rhodospirillales bacterium]
MSDSLDFYFDFSSPYGYLAAERIDGLAAKHGRAVTWRPMLLGAVFQKIGGSPLVDQPMKGPYSRHDMLRSARLHGIAFNVPDNFPVNSIAACRAYYWLADGDPATARDFALALYRGYFVENRDLSQPETVVQAAQAQGVDADALVAAVQDQAVKDRLRAENDAAIERGVFGSPTVFVGDEMFWGHDRLDMIDRWLETGGW